jgi:lipopolysaccharide transport system permease protein
MQHIIAKPADRHWLGPISAIIDHRSLVMELAKREVLGKYRGATFGLLWSLISPFMMLCVYTFAFGNVLKSRWPTVPSGKSDFALILFVGLIVHGFFAECLMRAPTLITNNANFVKKLVFPLDIMPWPMVLSTLFHLAMNFLVFFGLKLFSDGALAAHSLLLPVVLAPLVLLTLGVSWFLAALGVYFRDVVQVTTVLSTALFFLSSAIIPENAIPVKYRFLFDINPLTFIINQARNVVLWDVSPNWFGLGVYSLVAVVLAYLGRWWFCMTREGFADVL